MQQFTVPQFIDVESKIIGPITTRQFLIILGGAMIIGLSYRLFDFGLFLIITIVVSILMILFAFVKVNGRPFHFFVLNATQTLRRSNLRVWNSDALSHEKAFKNETPIKVEYKSVPKKYYKESHLAEIALIVDTKGKYKGE
ncbi:MAG: PrgI family protein [Patescibacteria group bacterium]|nr:PrgI family protein [Patescibacteria group bacterium]MDD3778235.1 PrgI family protein [Patescibacteria group bacterium]MDD3939554.1 PrgI family protein [Patescibacteria group bacterium]MDD4444061.1 PrgI family protein [Patescibacteria group bacterium]NCU39874.1 PrgI family protein [Candidatus Falkowbacteria bacterium]